MLALVAWFIYHCDYRELLFANINDISKMIQLRSNETRSFLFCAKNAPFYIHLRLFKFSGFRYTLSKIFKIPYANEYISCLKPNLLKRSCQIISIIIQTLRWFHTNNLQSISQMYFAAQLCLDFNSFHVRTLNFNYSISN